MHGHVQWSIYLISIIILHDYGVLLHVGYFYTVVYHTKDWDLDFGFIV